MSKPTAAMSQANFPFSPSLRGEGRDEGRPHVPTLRYVAALTLALFPHAGRGHLVNLRLRVCAENSPHQKQWDFQRRDEVSEIAVRRYENAAEVRDQEAAMKAPDNFSQCGRRALIDLTAQQLNLGLIT